MTELNDEVETVSHGLELQAAILHLLDGRHHNIVLSEQTLNLEDPQIAKYVKRYITRCKNDMRAKPGTFAEESEFARQLERYFHHESDLPGFTGTVCEPLAKYFEHEEARSFAVLAVDYRVDDVPYLAFILLEEVDTMTCITDSVNGRILNTVNFGTLSLPPFSRPITSFAVINQITGEILFVDQTKWNDGISVITDHLLDAEAGISRKEVVEHVKNIACEVAEEFHENPTILLSKVKNYISDTVKEGMPLSTESLAETVFDDTPRMAQAFREKAEEKTLPKVVELPKAPIVTAMKKQRISTDTGIEVSFPAEYFQNNQFIEFVNHPDGTISIEIKQISKITNKL